MLNEQFRIYDVVIWNKDGENYSVLRNRTKDEAKGALMHYIDSWTTRAISVVNRKTGEGKTWEGRPKKRK